MGRIVGRAVPEPAGRLPGPPPAARAQWRHAPHVVSVRPLFRLPSFAAAQCSLYGHKATGMAVQSVLIVTCVLLASGQHTANHTHLMRDLNEGWRV